MRCVIMSDNLDKYENEEWYKDMHKAVKDYLVRMSKETSCPHCHRPYDEETMKWRRKLAGVEEKGT